MKFQSFCCHFVAFVLLFVADQGLLSSLARASSAPVPEHPQRAGTDAVSNIPACCALPTIRGVGMSVEFDAQLHTRIGAQFQGESVLPVGPFSASEKLAGDNSIWENFNRAGWQCSAVHDSMGVGKVLVVTGRQAAWIKRVAVTMYNSFPHIAVFDVASPTTAILRSRPPDGQMALSS